MSSRHFINQEMLALLDNHEYSLTISLVGCGGTGSVVAIGLAKICLALKAQGKAIPTIRLYDGDILSEANIGRVSGMYETDIGRRKSDILVEKINRSFGLSFMSRGMFPEKIDAKANITISAVDTLKSRKDIIKFLYSKHKGYEHTFKRAFYLLDVGNTSNSLQMIVSTVEESKQPKSKYKTVSKLPTLFDIHKDIKEDKQEPSCSLRQSIDRQGMFTNQFAATFVLETLWKMLNEYYIEYSGLYFNQETMDIATVKL